MYTTKSAECEQHFQSVIINQIVVVRVKYFPILLFNAVNRHFDKIFHGYYKNKMETLAWNYLYIMELYGKNE